MSPYLLYVVAMSGACAGVAYLFWIRARRTWRQNRLVAVYNRFALKTKSCEHFVRQQFLREFCGVIEDPSGINAIFLIVKCVESDSPIEWESAPKDLLLAIDETLIDVVKILAIRMGQGPGPLLFVSVAFFFRWFKSYGLSESTGAQVRKYFDAAIAT